MKLMPRRQLTDKLAWHCRDKFSGCRSYHSVRPGSFFRSSRVPLKKAIHLIYLWAQDSSVKAVADTLDVSRQCVQQHFQFLREVCSTNLLANPMSLGGRNVIVQIDESLFRQKPKYHSGRAPAPDQCVFGLCDIQDTGPLCTNPHSDHRAGRAARSDHPQRQVGCLPATQRQLHVCHCQPQREFS